MKKTGKRIIGIVVLLLIVVLLQGSMVSTYNDEYKLILQFGKVVRVVETPGLSFKIPFLQTTQSIPNYEMIYDLIPSEVNTRDKKVMVTDRIVECHRSAGIPFQTRGKQSKCGKPNFCCRIQCCEKCHFLHGSGRCDLRP